MPDEVTSGKIGGAKRPKNVVTVEGGVFGLVSHGNKTTSVLW